MTDLLNINELLKMPLFIPDYQRPYKWTTKNVADLLDDINNAIIYAEKHTEYQYRIGTVILHRVDENNTFGIIDGQQRTITLLLLNLFLDNTFTCSLSEEIFNNPISQANIRNNYDFIKDWFSLKGKEYKNNFLKALNDILEVVIIFVDREYEAFQLFDSQNTRGKALDPHDLLKAYHLREMKDNQYEMHHAVTKWESKDSKQIRELFALYLYPIKQWATGVKSVPFSVKELDFYKGIYENSPYTYAKKANKSMPYFQITDEFIAGKEFFEMVEHYLVLLDDIKNEIKNNKKFDIIRQTLENITGTGFGYTKNLFYCAVLCYYDRFKNFDEQVIKKLFIWAFMLRVDMDRLGFDSVNKYAIGEYGNTQYSNNIAMFTKICNARLHSEIANLQIRLRESDKYKELFITLKKLKEDSIDE